MGFRELLFQKADIKSVTYNNSNERVPTIVASQIPTRTEPTSRLILSRDGREIQVNTLFFFDYNDIANIEPDFLINFSGKDYKVIRADLLHSYSIPHHWECWAR